MLPSGSSSNCRSTYTRCCSRAKSERFFIASASASLASHLCTHSAARRCKGNGAGNSNTQLKKVAAHILVHAAWPASMLCFGPGGGRLPLFRGRTTRHSLGRLAGESKAKFVYLSQQLGVNGVGI